jgi:sec-independent protein translocase protein TatA
MLFPLLLEGSEWLIVMVIVVVLVFGASKIPAVARSLGRASGEFQKGKVEAEIEVERMKARAGEASEPSSSSDHVRLLKAANELGASTGGKTDDRMQAEVSSALG